MPPFHNSLLVLNLDHFGNKNNSVRMDFTKNFRGLKIPGKKKKGRLCLRAIEPLALQNPSPSFFRI